MAGTGNLDVLRIARQLRKRHSPDVPYGSHMAVHMAIGLLFLGAGRYQLNYLLIIQCTSELYRNVFAKLSNCQFNVKRNSRLYNLLRYY